MRMLLVVAALCVGQASYAQQGIGLADRVLEVCEGQVCYLRCSGSQTLNGNLTVKGRLTLRPTSGTGVVATFRPDVDGSFLYLDTPLRLSGAVAGYAAYADTGSFSSAAGAGANAFGIVTNGARMDFGAGASDHATSDGTTVTFAGPLATAASQDITSGRSFITSSATGGVAVTGAGGVIQFAAKIAQNTAPSAVACTGATMTWSNGTAAFQFDVGTACATGTATITMPAATNRWPIRCENIITDRQIHCRGTSTTSVTCVQYTLAGAAQNFVDGDDIQCISLGG